MAAINLCHRVLKLNTPLMRLAAVENHMSNPCFMQQVRGSKTTRTKQPKQAKEKEKWIPRALKQASKSQTRIFPKNWDKFLTRKPADDVWIRTYYPNIKYSAEEAIAMHRELASPEMLNNFDGFVHFNAELNMTTSKKTKFISAFEGLVQVPHYFDDQSENKVLAFCKTKEEQAAALAEGAAFAGGLDLINQIEKGDVRPYMFDYAVCTADFFDSITKARKHIRDKFPNKRQDSVGPDIVSLVHSFRYGKRYSCTKTYDEVGVITVNIGQLGMPLEHLKANFKKFVDVINSHRNPSRVGKVTGVFMTKAFFTCPPSGEKIHLKDEDITSDIKQDKKLPESTLEDIEEQRETAVG